MLSQFWPKNPFIPCEYVTISIITWCFILLLLFVANESLIGDVYVCLLSLLLFGFLCFLTSIHVLELNVWPHQMKIFLFKYPLLFDNWHLTLTYSFQGKMKQMIVHLGTTIEGVSDDGKWVMMKT